MHARLSRALTHLGLTLLLSAPACRAPAGAVAELDPLAFSLGAIHTRAGTPAQLLEAGNDAIEIFPALRPREAALFALYLERAGRACGLEAEVEVRPGAGGCTVVASGEHKQLLAAHYPLGPGGDSASVPASLPALEPAQPALDPAHAFFDERARVLGFLAGVHLRHGERGALQFANATRKAELVRALLIEFGCTEVRLESSPRGSYPSVRRLSYVAGPEIAALFERVDAEAAALEERG